MYYFLFITVFLGFILSVIKQSHVTWLSVFPSIVRMLLTLFWIHLRCTRVHVHVQNLCDKVKLQSICFAKIMLACYDLSEQCNLIFFFFCLYAYIWSYLNISGICKIVSPIAASNPASFVLTEEKMDFKFNTIVQPLRVFKSNEMEKITFSKRRR